MGVQCRKMTRTTQGSQARDVLQLHLTPIQMAIPEISYDKLVEITGDFSDPVGEGSFSEVYRGYLDGREVAVKKTTYRNSADKIFWEHEKNMIMLFSRNPNIIKCYGCTETSKFPSLFLVMEYVPKKLRDVNDGKFEINWMNFVDIMAQTADALIHIHQHDRVFVDLKPENIMFFMEREGIRVKLIDLGSIVQDGVMDCKYYTLQYAAPEVSRKEDRSGRKIPITSKADVYSIGAIMLELLTEGAKEENKRYAASKSASIYELLELKKKQRDHIVSRPVKEKWNLNLEMMKNISTIVMSCYKEAPNQRVSMQNVRDQLLLLK
uniref:Protein kinase domain-containing protein n=2 Tax=Kalanchoe fedtschenkoi TaxID=63787 RepID=A0A7N0T599_KALFE